MMLHFITLLTSDIASKIGVIEESKISLLKTDVTLVSIISHYLLWFMHDIVVFK